MKLLLLLALGAFALTDVEQWVNFKAIYGKNYANEEESARYAIFVSNLRKAEQLSASDTATYGVTQFMDLTSEEFVATYTGLNVTSYDKWLRELPAFVAEKDTVVGTDWKAKGLVSSVKNQGSCGSCWAFSATAAAEGCYAVKYQKSIDLSAQQVVDCCHAGGSQGCNGGWQDSALQWAMNTNIATWNSYPYTGKAGTCKSVSTIGLRAHTCTYHSLARGESAMVSGLTHSTVAVAIDATPLQTYTSGVISSQCSYSSVNHAVLLVGDEGASNSYTVKNSWGASWGEKGFFRLAKGKDCLKIADRTAVAY
jgi:C1A family cysteine protease